MTTFRFCLCSCCIIPQLAYNQLIAINFALIHFYAFRFTPLNYTIVGAQKTQMQSLKLSPILPLLMLLAVSSKTKTR